MKIYQVGIVIALVACSALTGCFGGRKANLITIRQNGDETKSCNVLDYEMVTIQDNVNKLIPETSKTGKNTALAIGGLFVFPLWFFMDLSQAEQEEINAYKMRHDHLKSIYLEKKCDVANLEKK